MSSSAKAFAFTIVAVAFVGSFVAFVGSWGYSQPIGGTEGPLVQSAKQEISDLERKIEDCRAGKPTAVVRDASRSWGIRGSLVREFFLSLLFASLACLMFAWVKVRGIDVPRITLGSGLVGALLIPAALLAANIAGFAAAVGPSEAFFDYLKAVRFHPEIDRLRQLLSDCQAGA